MIPHNVRGVNIDLSARCTLECPMCSRTKLKKQGLKVPGEDVTFEQFKRLLITLTILIFVVKFLTRQ